MGEKTYKLYELTGNGRCQFARSFPVAVDSNMPVYAEKSRIMLTAIRQLFAGDMKDDEAGAYLKKEFAALPYPSDITRNIQMFDAWRQIISRVRSEYQMPKFCTKKTLNLGEAIGEDLPVDVDPTFRFDNPDGSIEIVRLQCRKSNVSSRNPEQDLRLYALLLYARACVPAGETRKIRAALEFLRRDDFKVTKGNPDLSQMDHPETVRADFYAPRGRNRVSIVETYTNDGSGTMSRWDRLFTPNLKNMAAGISPDDCTPDDCRKCLYNGVCHWQNPPIAIKKGSVVKSLDRMTLTAAQDDAVDYDRGICCINAGAGTGKTFVMTLRAVTLMNKGVRPEEILMITFTNNAAAEMRSRIQVMNDEIGTGEDISKMPILTFNAFGDSIIQAEYKRWFTEPPKLIDDTERGAIIGKLLSTHYIDGIDYANFVTDLRGCLGAVPAAEAVFDIAKRDNLTVLDADEVYKRLNKDKKGGFYEDGVKTVKALLTLYDEYDATLKKANLYEYADQEVLVSEVLHEDPFYLEKFGYKHVIVDEFQDTNAWEMGLIKRLRVCPSFESLMVVGDDSQAIYGFRDTSPEYIINFDEQIGETADRIDLLENFRCRPEIIRFANRVNARNKNRVRKNLVATRPAGGVVTVTGYYTSQEEMQAIADAIEKEVKKGRKPEDIAVLVRFNRMVGELAALLTEKGIPSIMMNPEKLEANSRVMAAVAMVKLCEDKTDGEALLTYTNARLHGAIHEGKLDAAGIEAEQKKSQSMIADLLKVKDSEEQVKQALRMLEDIDPLKDETYRRFLDTLRHYPTLGALSAYVRAFETYGRNDSYRRLMHYPGVVLTTAHSSKGLEWPVVFVSLSKFDESGIGDTDSNAFEETRRLEFVAATRARDELHISGVYCAWKERDPETLDIIRHMNRFLLEAAEITGKPMDINKINSGYNARAYEAQEERRKAVAKTKAVLAPAAEQKEQKKEA